MSDLPSRADFPAVSGGLEIHCGTLDCHGNTVRNFRIYGHYGQRLNQTVGLTGTTDDEHTATYESIVSIQPEVLSQIVRDHGARPERWIVITKGRGTEHHKGDRRMTKGDALDTCILSWLAGGRGAGPGDAGGGSVNQNACNQAAIVGPPSVDGGF